MRQLVSRLVLAQGLLAVACATAIDAPLEGDEGGGGSDSGGSLGSGSGGGKTGGSGAFGGTTSTGGGGMSDGGKAGSAAAGNGGVSSGGAGGAGGTGGTAGAGSGGKAGSTGNAGSANGGGGSGGGSAGTGSGGTPPSTTCDGVADWTSKTYAIGDVVASTCSGAFAHGCPDGESHKFECNPMAGTPALPWCRDREPGSGNGWWEAWVDKGQCE